MIARADGKGKWKIETKATKGNEPSALTGNEVRRKVGYLSSSESSAPLAAGDITDSCAAIVARPCVTSSAIYAKQNVEQEQVLN
jgi:hypothetical protein